MEEIWKDINGYEGLYQVSNRGNVRSMTVDISCGCKRKHRRFGKVLKQGTNPNGYKYVNLSKGSKAYSARVHRLVAEAFLDNKDNLPCINHKDENKANNAVENLEWCTFQYNLTYHDKQLCRASKVSQYTLNGEYVNTYASQAEAEKALGLKRSNISACCRGKIKSCAGYVWKYA